MELCKIFLSWINRIYAKRHGEIFYYYTNQETHQPKPRFFSLNLNKVDNSMSEEGFEIIFETVSQ